MLINLIPKLGDPDSTNPGGPCSGVDGGTDESMSQQFGIIPKLADPDSCCVRPPVGHPLPKRTVVQWDMGVLFRRGTVPQMSQGFRSLV